MSKMGVVVLRSLCVALTLVAIAAVDDAQFGCDVVVTKLAPCIAYASTGASRPTFQCCSGVRALNGMSNTPFIRRRVCNCLKTLANRLGRVAVNKAANLPALCRVPVPYPISPATNCNRVS